MDRLLTWEDIEDKDSLDWEADVPSVVRTLEARYGGRSLTAKNVDLWVRHYNFHGIIPVPAVGGGFEIPDEISTFDDRKPAARDSDDEERA